MTAKEADAITRNLIGRVNSAEAMGKKPGHLMVSYTICDPRASGAVVLKLHCVDDTEAPWNHLPSAKVGRFLALDGNGKPLYPEAEYPPEADDLKYIITKR